MKTLSALLLAAILPTASLTAQVNSGKIDYAETIKMNITLDGEAAQFAAMFPKEHTVKSELLFTPDAALFQNVKEAPEEAPDGPEGGMRIRMGGGEERKSFLDLKENKLVESEDFMGRKFLISGDVEKTAWKLTGAQKTILGYPCQEAAAIKEKDTLTAWFTTGIPVSAGPHAWTGLPGMILEASRNSDIHIIATAVTPGDVPAGTLTKPRSGKKVTRAEYKAIVDEKMKEMGAEAGGGGNVRILIRN